MIEPDAEARLVAALRSNDLAARKAALGELYEHLSATLSALCLRMAGDRGDAEDAVQETFLAVLRGVGGFRGESRLSTWVIRIAIHSATRVRSRRSKRVLAPLPDDGAASPSLGEQARGADPESEAIEREDSQRVLAAIARLPAAQRAVLGLAATAGLDRAEIASVLGLPIGTVDSRLSVARASLREELARRSGSDARRA